MANMYPSGLRQLYGSLDCEWDWIIACIFLKEMYEKSIFYREFESRRVKNAKY